MSPSWGWLVRHLAAEESISRAEVPESFGPACDPSVDVGLNKMLSTAKSVGFFQRATSHPWNAVG